MIKCSATFLLCAALCACASTSGPAVQEPRIPVTITSATESTTASPATQTSVSQVQSLERFWSLHVLGAVDGSGGSTDLNSVLGQTIKLDPAYKQSTQSGTLDLIASCSGVSVVPPPDGKGTEVMIMLTISGCPGMLELAQRLENSVQGKNGYVIVPLPPGPVPIPAPTARYKHSATGTQVSFFWRQAHAFVQISKF